MKYTKQGQVHAKVQSLEIGDSFNKKEFIITLWGRSDYFIDRSFDVVFNTAKKQFENRKFKTEKGFIIRTQ